MEQITEGFTQELYDTYFRTIQEMVSVSNDTIANQLSSTNTLLVIVSFVLVFVGAGVSIYINSINRKLKKIKKSVEAKQIEVESWAKVVSNTERMIKSDLSGLYNQLRLEETKSMLKRLDNEPEDIINLAELLAARDIPRDCFDIFMSAYSKLQKNSKKPEDFAEEKERYHLLFFQHFLKESINNELLRPHIVNSFPMEVRCAFLNDLIRATNSLCQLIKCDTVSFDRENLLASYLKAINSSKYSETKEIKDILQDQLSTCGLLTEAIEKCRKDGVCLAMFGVEAENFTIFV